MDIPGFGPTINLSREAVLDFAIWSDDRNPLHVDEAYARQTHFGRQVVHGVLSVLESLRVAAPRGVPPIRTVDIEFRAAVLIGESYRSQAAMEGSELVLGLSAGDQRVLNLRAGFEAPSGQDVDLSWVASADRGVLDSPATRELDELQRGVIVTGRYASPAPTPWSDGGVLSPSGARVLALCSYVTGMEVPGLKSLFTRITLAFHHDAADGAELVYRARTTRFDAAFRLLDTELVVATAEGRLVATGLLRSYVPFSPVRSDLSVLADRLTDGARTLTGKVALVTGGSRGLGADVTSALALAGCHVYVSARHQDEECRTRHQELRAAGALVDFVQGDAGDPDWCDATIGLIGARHGHLDVLVLNACAPPAPTRLGRDTASARERYLRDNLRLVEAPLTAGAAAVAAANGVVVFVSSSFVEDTPAGFSHYVALKQAGEALLRTAIRERPALRGVIARPPVLQTRWNDTPSGVVGSIPSSRAATHIVNALGESGTSGAVATLSEYPPFADTHTPPPKPPALVVRLAATFTTDAVVPALQFWVKDLALDAAVEATPYGQVLQSLLDPSSLLNARGRGANVLLVRVRDWLRELPDDHVSDIDRVKQFLQRTAQDFEAAVRAHRAQAATETLLVLCPSYGATSSAESILIRQTEDAIAANLSTVAGLQVVSAADFHKHYHVDEDVVHDQLRDHIAHIPYRDDYFYVLAAIVSRHVYRRLAPVRKVVVVDCDNTLWHGVVGEVGAEGVAFDDGHRALHALLARLTESGVLVCLCSKNEEPDVWRVFDTRPDFGLRRDQVVAAMVNWLPKSQNLRTLAARLNLGLDSFAFLDDNPVECAEVRAGCPEVLTLQWPTDPDQAIALTRHIWEFDGGKATREDAKRTALYKEEFRRQEARADTLTFEDFIKKLQLEVDFAPLAAEDLRRSAQLTLRTNQFNFTTIRREEADVQALAAAGRHEIRTVRVRDRFGDYGLVGLVIAERGAEEWTLDTFLLSCRVLGRGVEHRIVSDLGQMAAAAGARRVKLRVDATKRNTPARSFFEAVIPVEYREGDERQVRAEVPVDALAAVHFEPATAGDVVVQDEGGGRGAVQPVDASDLRRRETQIARAAHELATGPAMRAAAGHREATSAADQTPSAASTSASESDVAAVVHGAFASALRVSAKHVAQVDRLEALGCDSLRIVEITVALSERYPWLPSTLLFEHRAVSQIVREIVLLSQPKAAPTAPVRQTRPRVETKTSGDIAIVGIGVRCAGADSPDELWQLLRSGGSAVKPVPANRDAFLRPLVDERPHWAGLLDHVGRFDPEFFGVSPREAEVMDPQLRLFLEVAWAALEDAGAVGDAHEADTGVFAGVMYGDYGYRANAGSVAGASPYRCWEGFSLANRLSQLLGFHGPSLAVETACSSSGTALHLACAAIKAGDCRAALAGGVNLILDPDRFGSLGRLGILSARGVCEPFGADADGTVLGEGAGVVVLRPLADALARGDRIHGVIKGSGLSTGSGTVGFTAPNPHAQSDAIRRSLRAAGVDPRTVSYIETHGTGTLLGDPIEIRGLSLAYGDTELQEPGVAIAHRCAIGSVKPNVGHLEAGAGVLGLIKVLLQFRHRALVPSLTSAQASPQIPFGQVPFVVQRLLTDWPQPVMTAEGQTVLVPRRAGLNSFGVGGANAHLIVEEPPQPAAPRPAASVDRPLHVLALSGVNDAALERQAQRIAAFVEAAPDLVVEDACYAVNTGRRHLARRRAVVAAHRDDLLRGLRPGAHHPDAGTSAPPRIAFLFTGQGSQYAGMGQALYDTQPVFRAALERCASVFDALLDRSLLDLLRASEGSPEADLLHQTGYTQPALFAFQYALAELWRSWGVVPDVVMGHSVGEIAAMCVAGGVSLEDGLTLIAARGRLMQALPAGGVMTSVMADEARVQAAIENLRETVAIAAVNGPGQVVISGAGAAVAEISARLGADGIKTKALTVSHAFHSPLMKPMLADYERVVRGMRFAAPRTPLVSCVEGALAGDQLTQPDYWRRQVLDPVRFAAGMRVLESQGVGAYVEIGPHPVLVGMGRQCVGDESQAVWVPSMRKGADPWRTMLEGVGQLYERGVNIDWTGFDGPYRRTRVTIPGYAFNEREYWLKHVPALEQVPADHVTAPQAPAGPQYYELRWQPQPPAVVGAGVAPVRWAVFADDSGVGRALAQQLEASGATVALVERGTTCTQDGTRHRIDPNDPSHYEQLLRRLAGGPADPALRVVHLWSLDAPANERLGTDPSAAAAQAVSSLAFLARAAASAGAGSPRITAVTQGAVGLADDGAPPCVSQAAVWGMGRTIALEHPDVWAGLVDVEPAEPARAADQVLAELGLDSGEDQVAVRSRGRFVPRLVEASGLPQNAPVLSPDGLYLVTGGLGALGLQTAQWLVSRGARHLVLASRGADTAKAAQSLAALRSGDVTVDVVAADVSRADAVDALLTRIAAGAYPLRGVVHAAGIDTIIPIAQLTADQVRDAVAAKAGGWLLHERTRQMPLDLFLCFSSVASVLGAQGRGHYAAANAFLDGLAAERRRLKLPVTAVNWGPWRGGGMATAEHLQQFERIGNRGLEPAAALRALDAAVTSGRSQVIVADIDWDVFKPAYESRRPRPVLASLRAKVPSEIEAAATQAPWLARLGGMAPDTRETALTGLVQQEVAETMGFDQAESVPVDRNFYEMGIDSLMMADLVGRIRKQVGFSCSALVFEYPTVRDFSHHLLPRLPLTTTGAAEAPSAHASLTPTHATGISPELEAEILSFQHEAFPTRQRELVPDRWRWMFVESARRLDESPRFWVHRDSGRIVGQKGSIPVRLKVGERIIPTRWLVETMVLDSYRHQAVGSRLMVQAHEDQPFSLSLGQSPEMREIQFRLGWTQVAPLQIGQRVLNPTQVLSGKVPKPAAWAAGLGLKASTLMRDLVRERRQTEVREVAAFGERHDRLWHDVSAHYRCAVVRDASYLNWKYVQQPGQQFLRLEILESGRPQAVAVWMFRPPDGQYRYGRAFLVDLVAPVGDAVRLQQIVAASCAAVEGDGVDALLCHHTDARLTRALRASGFLMRKPERFLLVDAEALGPEAKAVVLDPDAWFVTQGDSDIDRPW